MMGFAVLMFGMSAMSGAVSGLGEQAWFLGLLTSLSNPLLGILVGRGLHRDPAVRLRCGGYRAGPVRDRRHDLGAALPLLMGIAIGASFPVLLSALGANTDGKRTALVYLVASLLGVLVCAVHVLSRTPSSASRL